MIPEKEQRRIDLLKTIKSDSNEITVGMTAELFVDTLHLLEEHTNTFKKVKAKLSDGEWTAFINAILLSYLSSLYATAAKDEKEREKRVKLLEKVNGDLAVGMAIGHKRLDA